LSEGPFAPLGPDGWICRGMYSRPAEPIPFIRPNFAPFFETHIFPLRPSVTNGIRSFRRKGAFEVKRSGGSQMRSIWQSAEMNSYFTEPILLVAMPMGWCPFQDEPTDVWLIRPVCQCLRPLARQQIAAR